MKKIRVEQRRSVSGQVQRRRATLKGLGLRRIGHAVELNDTPAIRGMIMSVQDLVSVNMVDAKES